MSEAPVGLHREFCLELLLIDLLSSEEPVRVPQNYTFEKRPIEMLNFISTADVPRHVSVVTILSL